MSVAKKVIVVRSGGVRREIDISSCFWCGELEAICAVCHARANASRAELSHQPKHGEIEGKK